MPISDYLNQTASLVSRSQHTLFDGAATATLSGLAAVPSVDFRLVVEVSGGAANTGSVTATGSLDGSAKTETFTFTGARSRTGTVLFDTITEITTAGLADEDPVPDVTITCIDSTGSPIMKESTTSIQCRLVDNSKRGGLPESVWTTCESVMYTLPAAVFGINSIIRYNSIDYTVQAVKTPRGRLGTEHHKKAALDRI